MGARSPSSYRVSADLFLRALSLIYLCAFVSLWIQLPGLYSSAGLLPIDRILSEVRDFQGSDLELWNLLRKNPSLIVLGTALGTTPMRSWRCAFWAERSLRSSQRPVDVDLH